MAISINPVRHTTATVCRPPEYCIDGLVGKQLVDDRRDHRQPSSVMMASGSSDQWLCAKAAIARTK
jgi:hypothetical protein